MGAETFGCRVAKSSVKSPQEAFQRAQEDARHENGHGGYTGTIAEKSSFVYITPPLGADPADYANQLMEDGDKRIDNKWGPAGMIEEHDAYFFFGWASC
jgi:hypothetical protein